MGEFGTLKHVVRPGGRKYESDDVATSYWLVEEISREHEEMKSRRLAPIGDD